jgi:hypothetical protein
LPVSRLKLQRGEGNLTPRTLPMGYKQCQFGRSRSVMKGTLLERQKSCSSLSGLAMQRGDWKVTPGCPTPCARTRTPLIEVDLQWTARDWWGPNSLSSLSRLAMQQGDWNVTPGIPPHALQAVQVWSKLVNNEWNRRLGDPQNRVEQFGEENNLLSIQSEFLSCQAIF